MEPQLILVILIIIVALAFDFLNGMNDAANSIATIVSTRVLSPRMAVAWAAFFNFAAVFIFGVHVANTVGKGIVDPSVISDWMILAGLLSAVVWTYFCTVFGMPISVSHSLLGGLVGAGIAKGGFAALVSSGVIKVGIFIVLSPLIGMIMAYFLMMLTFWIFRRWAPRSVDSVFRVGQLLSSAAFSLGHGGNDAQKTAGIISVLLFSTGYMGGEFHVPVWVIVLSYTVIALGTLIGGWKVIRMLGVNLTHLRPVHGFCAETASAVTLFATGLMGIPVSTTHSITGSIMGVGMTRRLSSVRWGVAGNIVMTWILTIPATAILAGLFYLAIAMFV